MREHSREHLKLNLLKFRELQINPYKWKDGLKLNFSIYFNTSF